jgi:xylulokinase
MGLIDVKAGDWSDTLLKSARLTREQLPQLFRPGEIMGEVSPQAAKRTGLKAGTPVAAGGGDGQCAGAGANNFLEGRAYVNLGTATVSGNYGKSFAIDRSFRAILAVAEEGYSFETAIRTGTFLVNWMVERLFNINPAKDKRIFATLEAEAKAIPIGANGLVMVPYWSGCMTPYWDSNARGVIAGLSGNHGRAEVYRALLEGVALEQAMMTDKVAEATAPITHFAAVGGGSRSDLWCQILADASGREVKRLETAEASALGAAMAAAKGAGWHKRMADAAGAMSGKPSKTFRPRTKDSRRYRELLEIYTELWPKLSQWNGKLAAFAARDAR